MRKIIRAVLAVTLLGGPIRATADDAGRAGAPHVQTELPGQLPAPWGRDVQPDPAADPGFAPLSVTQGGMAYSPPAADSGSSEVDASSLADLPAWASTLSAKSAAGRPGFLAEVGRFRFGTLPEPLAWLLIVLGVAMIGAALRGLLIANRRLKMLREEEDVGDDPVSTPRSR